ncbi:MAG: glycosyltransferase [Bacteroides sp.]|jgi:glycosyltransferase involved in cell wall biosynthesis|nr:glycosyltransferase [Bacteroides sp.]MCI1681980.1 glycosyltransferase [Bacteroides sp.]
MNTFTFDTIEQILLAVVGILFIVQSLYYLLVYNRIHLRNRAVKKENVHFNEELSPVSVIICASEEVDNLRNNLTAVLRQDYPQFEVIVINDGNTDESADYLTLLSERYRNLYHSFVPDSSRYISRKKLAITLGIKASKYDWVVFTEANCRPESNQWLRMLARNFTSRAQVVLGYSGYERGNKWVHKKISFDNLFTSMRYLGMALAGHPYMGIGRNMAYRKELFYAQKGFSTYLNLQRGDDDLFINQIATTENTRVEIDKDAIVRMQPVPRTKDWKEEKIGYRSTGKYYHGIQRHLIGMETASRLLFHLSWITTVVVGLLNKNWIIPAIVFFLFLLRFTMQAIIINTTAKELNEKRRYYFSLPLFDILQPLQSLQWNLYCLFRKKSDFTRK